MLSSSNLVVNVCIVEYRFNPGRIQGGAQGARAPPLISRVVIFQPIIISYTIYPPVSDMLVPDLNP